MADSDVRERLAARRSTIESPSLDLAEAEAAPTSRPHLVMVPSRAFATVHVIRIGTPERPVVAPRVASSAPVTAFDAGDSAAPAAVPGPLRLTRLGRLVLGLVAVMLAITLGGLAAKAGARFGHPAPDLPRSLPAVVVVQPGETLWTIAQRVAPERDPRQVVSELRRLNALPSGDVRVGQQLRLHGP